MDRSLTKCPKGYKVTTYRIKDDPNLKDWFNFKIWKDGRQLLDGAATAFYTADEAKRVGISYSWDIFEKKSQWT